MKIPSLNSAVYFSRQLALLNANLPLKDFSFAAVTILSLGEQIRTLATRGDLKTFRKCFPLSAGVSLIYFLANENKQLSSILGRYSPLPDPFDLLDRYRFFRGRTIGGVISVEQDSRYMPTEITKVLVAIALPKVVSFVTSGTSKTLLTNISFKSSKSKYAPVRFYNSTLKIIEKALAHLERPRIAYRFSVEPASTVETIIVTLLHLQNISLYGLSFFNRNNKDVILDNHYMKVSSALINFYCLYHNFGKSSSIKNYTIMKTQMILLAGLLQSLKGLATHIYPKLLLLTELEEWKNSLPKNTNVDVDKVFSKISAAIVQSGDTYGNTVLNLSNCNLEEVPPVVWKLKNIQLLDLSNNEIKQISPEIKNLKELRDLTISGNELNSLPKEIGDLNKLYELILPNNKLTSLPTELGNLEHLRRLIIRGNRDLSSLPASLNNLISLETIICAETSIPESEVERIRIEIKERKVGLLRASLSTTVLRWKSIAKIKDHSLDFIEQLTESQRDVIADWLRRLERTVEYQQGNQEALATVATNMLKTLKTDSSFKEAFFSYVAANNTNCEDRASMSLNEIYVLWLISKLEKDENATLADKVSIYLRAVKTYTFRYYISRWIQENMPNNPESVEVFLFYDNLLKNKLGLISPTSTMRYNVYGNQLDKLPEDKVIKDVEDSYLDDIFVYPAFEKLIENDSDFIAMQQGRKEELEEEMGELDDEWSKKQAKLTRDTREYYAEEEKYKEQSDALQKEYEGLKKEVAVLWLRRKAYIAPSNQLLACGYHLVSYIKRLILPRANEL